MDAPQKTRKKKGVKAGWSRKLGNGLVLKEKWKGKTKQKRSMSNKNRLLMKK